MIQRFEGHFMQRIDPKGRTSVPSKFRNILEKNDQEELVVAASSNWLDAWPLPHWEEHVKQVQTMPPSPETEEYYFVYISSAQRVGWDKSGRILVPQFLRELVNIEKDSDIAIVGMHTLFRIMAKAAYDEYFTGARSRFAQNRRFVNTQFKVEN